MQRRRCFAGAYQSVLTFAAGLLPLQGVAAGATDGSAGTPALEEIVVIGSTIRLRKDEVESQALPVELIEQETIARSGSTSVADFTRDLPIISGGGATSTDGDAYDTISLRGIGDKYTLVLLNGRRISIDGPANVAAIPVEAIERIEILKAGSSALYGSDAVAGVVNFVVKSSFEGVGAKLSYASAADGYEQRQGSAYLGAKSDRGTFFLLGDYLDRDPLYAVDRPLTATNDLTSIGGQDMRSSFNIPGNVFTSTGRFIIDTDQIHPGETSLDLADFRPFDFARDSHDRPQSGLFASAPVDQKSLVVNASHEMGSRTTLSLNLLYSQIETEARSGASTFVATVPATNFYNPFGEEVYVLYRGLDVGGLAEQFQINRESVTASARIDFAITDRLQLSLSANLLDVSTDNRVPTYYSSSGLDAALARTDETAFNPFGNYANGPDQLRGVRVGGRNQFDYDLYEYDARVSGAVADLPTGPLQLTAGVALRDERTALDWDSRVNLGDILDVAQADDTRLSRDVKSAFAEFRIPLLAGETGSGAPRLEASVAGRYEDYDDFGSTFDPMVALRWEPTGGQWLVRASYSTGFSPPYLSDLTGEPGLGAQPVYDPTVDAVVDATVITGGNPDLKPEESNTVSLGVVFTPAGLPGLFASLDVFRLRQTDVIAEPSAQAIISGLVPGTVIRGPEAIAIGGRPVLINATKQNIGNRELTGADLALRYRWSLAGDRSLNLGVAATTMQKFEVDLADGEGSQDVAGTYSFLFKSLPEWRARADARFAAGPWELSAFINYTDGLTDPPLPGVFESSRHVPSLVTGDLALSFDARASGRSTPRVDFKAVVGVKNVTDEQPPFIRAAQDIRLGAYDITLYDIRGRTWYGSLMLQF